MKKLFILFSLVIYLSISCVESSNNEISNAELETKGETVAETSVVEETVIEEKVLQKKSMSVISNSEVLWSIYQDVDKTIKEKSNAKIKMESIVINVEGSMDGIETNDYEIGWNNMDVILYIEIMNNTLTTTDGLTIGSTKEEVLDALGKPHSTISDSLRYQNSKYETFGILFLLDENDIVTNIILFAYV